MLDLEEIRALGQIDPEFAQVFTLSLSDILE